MVRGLDRPSGQRPRQTPVFHSPNFPHGGKKVPVVSGTLLRTGPHGPISADVFLPAASSNSHCPVLGRSLGSTNQQLCLPQIHSPPHQDHFSPMDLISSHPSLCPLPRPSSTPSTSTSPYPHPQDCRDLEKARIVAYLSTFLLLNTVTQNTPAQPRSAFQPLHTK